MMVAFDKTGGPVTADDLGVTGALMVLMKDAIDRTLMQTLEGSPVLVYAGPFANIAHGRSSIIADSVALKWVGENGYVITETGFGSDIGMEKFFNIKCRASGHIANAIVLVATIRAHKMHSGGPAVTPGAPLEPEYTQENIPLLENGLKNLIKHISNGNKFGVLIVVAINKHTTDTDTEISLVQNAAIGNGAFEAVVCTHWAEGGTGAAKLADAIIAACEKVSSFHFLYDVNKSIEEKILTIAREMYGAGSAEYNERVKASIDKYREQGFDNLPICMAKTPLSLTADPNIKGPPTDFVLKINDISISVGAGFIITICGEILTMPGLPISPSIFDIDLNTETGEIEGLF